MLARPLFSHCHRWDWRGQILGLWFCMVWSFLQSSARWVPGTFCWSSTEFWIAREGSAFFSWVVSARSLDVLQILGQENAWSPYLWMAQKLALKSLHPPMVWIGRIEPMGPRRWCKQWVVWLLCLCIHLGMIDCRISCVHGLRMGHFSELQPLDWSLSAVTLMGSWFSWLFWERLGDLGLLILVETWIGSLSFWGTWSCSSLCWILSTLSWKQWLAIRFGHHPRFGIFSWLTAAPSGCRSLLLRLHWLFWLPVKPSWMPISFVLSSRLLRWLRHFLLGGFPLVGSSWFLVLGGGVLLPHGFLWLANLFR